MKKTSFNFIGLLVFFVVSCEKDELPIQPHVQGEETVAHVEMGEDYRNQLFFSLENNTIVRQNLKTEWDLSFEASDTGYHVRLNTAKGMAASKKTGTFSEITDTLNAIWQYDIQSGHQDSTAIGNWQNYNGVYIIDRGYDHLGVHQGFAKMKIIEVNSFQYQIEFGNLSDTNPQGVVVNKNSNYSFIYFSFSSGTTISIAPEKDKFDIIITQYTHVFDGHTPYVVTGVLLNPYQTSAVRTTDLSFENITYETAQSFAFSTDYNVIGYDWKYYDFDAGQYLVDPSINYIIKTQNGYYYKLHFTDFYNESGIKGWPKFEFQRL